MPIKKVKRDFGMREHEVEQYGLQSLKKDEQEKLIAALKNMVGPDEARNRNADHIKNILAEAGIESPFDPEIKVKVGEEAFHVLGAEWLRNYIWLEKEREKIEAGTATSMDVSRLIDCAQTLGTIQERIWWRYGIDPATGAKRESLALSARGSRRALDKGAQAKDAHNSAVSAEADKWKRAAQNMANEIWAKNPGLSKTAVAKIVNRKWPAEAGDRRSVVTIRMSLQKPDRA